VPNLQILLSVHRRLAAGIHIVCEELNYGRALALRIQICMRGANLRTENTRTLASRIRDTAHFWRLAYIFESEKLLISANQVGTFL
jgi:hypothetical protein